MKCFGLTGFRKGWKKKITGKDYPPATIEHFLELKDRHIKAKEKI